MVTQYHDAVAEQRETMLVDLSEIERMRVATREKSLIDLGAPADLAHDAALLSPTTTALDVADLARRTAWPLHAAGVLHCVVGAEFGLDALRDAAANIKLDQHWDRLVTRRAAEDFGQTQLKLAEAAAHAIGRPKADAGEAVRVWGASLGQPAQRARDAFAELSGQGAWTFAKLMLVQAELAALTSALR